MENKTPNRGRGSAIDPHAANHQIRIRTLAAIKRSGLSDAAVAIKAGIAAARISRWRSGKIRMTLASSRKILAVI